ncbi:hypothetical protein AU504_11915 [Lonsdalea populi]|nr:hypothetical protein AU508_11415 [Lonsdalea populi]RAT68863.1 hypothetical protein AU504_11915 [Lonsdalea populi]RAT71133.1 hypothetical protein AU505_09680 [Lonsdalea populi]RAT75062.1 hypothetical protein AU506_11045 [Lonsdalea populi]RAT79973.1 hypothetical protein AU507_00980 [Lonsdalea populi]
MVLPRFKQKGAEAPTLDQPSLCKRRCIGSRHHDMIQRANLHQRQNLFQPLRQHLVCMRRLRIPARMVVREDHCRRIDPQRFLDHFARIHRGAVDGAVEHLPILDQPVARIQEQHRKDFMLEACHLVAQVLFDQRRGSELSTTLHLQINGLACGFKNLIHRRWQVAPLGVTHQQSVIEREKGQLRHDRAPVARAELPGTVASTAQRKAVRGRSRPPACKHAQPLTLRTP